VEPIQEAERDAIDQAIAEAAGDDPDDDGLDADGGVGPIPDELDLSNVDPRDMTPQMLRLLAESKESKEHPAKCFSCKHPWHVGSPCQAALKHDGVPTQEICGCPTAVA
jgi:hypothetical protein